MRDARKGAAWKESGCEIALADMRMRRRYRRSQRVDGIFVIMPPIFDRRQALPRPSHNHRRDEAIGSRKPPKVVCLSTIGAQATQLNLLNQLGLLEQALGAVQSPVCFLTGRLVHGKCGLGRRPGARHGCRAGFLQPLDKPVPMVATADIGHLAATLLQETWTGRRIVELGAVAKALPVNEREEKRPDQYEPR